MIGVVVSAHGLLAEALIDTARTVMGKTSQVTAVSIEEGDDTASYGDRLRSAVAGVQTESGVLVLTDMFGGTPSNVSLTLHQPGRVEVLTGVNLPMVIKALQVSQRNLDLSEAASQVKASGRRAITLATEVLSRPQADDSGKIP